MPNAASAGNPQDTATTTLDPNFNTRLDNLDDNLNPINPTAANDDEDNNEETEEENSPASEDNNEEQQTEAEHDDEGESTEEQAAEDDGYTIDEQSETEENETVTDKTDTPAQLAPEDQYILEGVKDYALTVRGYVGDSKTVQEFKVLAPEQLPQGFSYVDGREMAIASKGFAMLENRAVQLQTQYRNEQNQSQTKDFEKRELLGEQRDIGDLQRSGEIPKFIKNPDLPRGFDNKSYRNVINLLADNGDKGAQVVKDVLDFKDKQNDRYTQEYASGLPWRHIGFEEAYRMYQQSNPTKSDPKQVKEDAERKAFAKRTGSTRGSSTTNSNVGRPKLRPGASSRDLDLYIESLDI